jgi:hypothetical protein
VVISGYSRILHPKKTDYKDITEILLKVALNTIILTPLHENVLGLNSISDELDSGLGIFMKLFIILYADDTYLMAKSSRNLQTLLHKLYLYRDTWKMKVNVDKRKIVVFSKGQLPRKSYF